MSKREKRDFTNKTYNNLIALMSFLATIGFIVCKFIGFLQNRSWWWIIVPWGLAVLFRAGDDDDNDSTDNNNNLQMA